MKETKNIRKNFEKKERMLERNQQTNTEESKKRKERNTRFDNRWHPRYPVSERQTDAILDEKSDDIEVSRENPILYHEMQGGVLVAECLRVHFRAMFQKDPHDVTRTRTAAQRCCVKRSQAFLHSKRQTLINRALGFSTN